MTINDVWNKLTRGLNSGGFTYISSSTVVMSVAGVYATGDYMGTSVTPQAFPDVVRSPNGTAVIKSISITDKSPTTNVAMELWLYSATFTAPTDNAAWDITDTQNLTFIGVIPIATTGWFASASNQNYFDGTICIPIKPAGTSLFYALVARGTTPSFTSLDLAISIGILQD